jgi:tubulin polyglutamylase TTLL11
VLSCKEGNVLVFQIRQTFQIKYLQILGFDILLTDDLRPILLEINACPSLSLGHDPDSSGSEEENASPNISVVDEAIKVPLVFDTLRLLMDELDVSKPQRFG